jgi:murein L,D-transpeptidase YafK
MTAPPDFKEQQLKFDRVKSAYEEKATAVKDLLKGVRGKYNIFLRAFKKEKELEVWIKTKDTYSLLTKYDFCTTSGVLGPKRKEGDLQIPEGVYHINHFNPFSTFHLSLGINYPNTSDKILGDKKHPGGSIYIHGNCVSIGCIPITDDKIKELYILAVEAKNGGQSDIPVHIFPARNIEELPASAFWNNLKTVYDDFEKNKKLRSVSVDKSGAYVVE